MPPNWQHPSWAVMILVWMHREHPGAHLQSYRHQTLPLEEEREQHMAKCSMNPSRACSLFPTATAARVKLWDTHTASFPGTGILCTQSHSLKEHYWMYCTMAHFSLGISANDLQVPGRHEEAILLLWGGLGEKSGEEHAQVKVQRFRSSTVNKAVKNCHGMGAWRECYGREASMRIHGGDSGRDKKKKKNDSCVNQNSVSVF